METAPLRSKSMELHLSTERAAGAIRALYAAAQKVAALAAGPREAGEAGERRALFEDEPTFLHVWADVTLHNAPVKAPFTPRTMVFPSRVQAPGQRICAFCRDDQLEALEARGEFDKCLSYRAMRKEYPAYAQRRALAREFGIFCCEDSCFMKLAQYGGKALVSSRRPICLPGSILAATRELVSRSFTLCPINKPRCGVCVGVLTFGPALPLDEGELSGVLKNVEALGPRLAEVVPAGALNVKLVELRADMRFLRDVVGSGCAAGALGQSSSSASARAGAPAGVSARTPAGNPLPSELDEALRIPKIPIYQSSLEAGARLIDQAPLREVDPLDKALEELRVAAEEEGLYDGESLHSSYQGSEAEGGGEDGDGDEEVDVGMGVVSDGEDDAQGGEGGPRAEPEREKPAAPVANPDAAAKATASGPEREAEPERPKSKSKSKAKEHGKSKERSKH